MSALWILVYPAKYDVSVMDILNYGLHDVAQRISQLIFMRNWIVCNELHISAPKRMAKHVTDASYYLSEGYNESQAPYCHIKLHSFTD